VLGDGAAAFLKFKKERIIGNRKRAMKSRGYFLLEYVSGGKTMEVKIQISRKVW
jgi:hypothetical protein